MGTGVDLPGWHPCRWIEAILPGAAGRDGETEKTTMVSTRRRSSCRRCGEGGVVDNVVCRTGDGDCFPTWQSVGRCSLLPLMRAGGSTIISSFCFVMIVEVRFIVGGLLRSPAVKHHVHYFLLFVELRSAPRKERTPRLPLLFCHPECARLCLMPVAASLLCPLRQMIATASFRFLLLAC